MIIYVTFVDAGTPFAVAFLIVFVLLLATVVNANTDTNVDTGADAVTVSVATTVTDDNDDNDDLLLGQFPLPLPVLLDDILKIFLVCSLLLLGYQHKCIQRSCTFLTSFLIGL